MNINFIFVKRTRKHMNNGTYGLLWSYFSWYGNRHLYLVYLYHRYISKPLRSWNSTEHSVLYGEAGSQTYFCVSKDKRSNPISTSTSFLWCTFGLCCSNTLAFGWLLQHLTHLFLHFPQALITWSSWLLRSDRFLDRVLLFQHFLHFQNGLTQNTQLHYWWQEFAAKKWAITPIFLQGPRGNVGVIPFYPSHFLKINQDIAFGQHPPLTFMGKLLFKPNYPQFMSQHCTSSKCLFLWTTR